MDMSLPVDNDSSKATARMTAGTAVATRGGEGNEFMDFLFRKVVATSVDWA